MPAQDLSPSDESFPDEPSPSRPPGAGKTRRRVLSALGGIGVFVAGALAGPALGDVYEWVWRPLTEPRWSA